MKQCANCEKETANKKFCSRNCAGLHGIKKLQAPSGRKCYRCGEKYDHVINKSSNVRNKKLCPACNSSKSIHHLNRVEKLISLTVGELKEKLKKSGVHSSWGLSELRGFNRLWNKHLLKRCQVCNYDRHVELAHIRPVSSFPEDALIVDINSDENVRGLCPNHHWELDNGFIDADTIPVIKRECTIKEMLLRKRHTHA